MLTVYLNYSSGALCAVIKLKINYLVKRSVLYTVQNLANAGSVGRLNFTLVHEAAHQILGMLYYRPLFGILP